MEPREKLERELQEDGWGEFIDLDSLVEPYGKLLREITNLGRTLAATLQPHVFERWKNRPLQIEFSNSSDVNALSQRVEDHDFVVVSIGAIESIFGTMLGLMSAPEIFPTVGNCKGEIAPDGSFPTGFGNLHFRSPDDTRPIALHLPCDPTRRAFAMVLADTACSFLVYHELGHILGGHLELLESGGFRPQLIESIDTDKATDEFELRRILECDADTFAAFGCGAYVALSGAGQSLKTNFDWHEVTADDAGYIATAFSIGTLFRAFYGAPFAANGLYPHPAVRSNLVVSRLYEIGRLSGRYAIDDLPRLINKTLFPIENAWRRWGLPGNIPIPPNEWGISIAKATQVMSAEYLKNDQLLTRYARLPRKWHLWPTEELIKGIERNPIDHTPK